MAAALGRPWSDEFLVAVRAYFAAMDMLVITKEQWVIVAIDHRDEDPHGQRSSNALRQESVQAQREGLETDVERNDDDGGHRGNDGALDRASLRLDVCGSCLS